MNLKPGDVCIILPVQYGHLDGLGVTGKECTLITRHTDRARSLKPLGMLVPPYWLVQMDIVLAISEYRLQKKRPPGEETGDWDDTIDIYVPPHIKERVRIEEETEA